MALDPHFRPRSVRNLGFVGLHGSKQPLHTCLMPRHRAMPPGRLTLSGSTTLDTKVWLGCGEVSHG